MSWLGLGMVLTAACDGELVKPTVRLLIPGDARLAGFFGEGACSRAAAAAGGGHRWCGFHRATGEEPARTELWVIDVSRVLAGEKVPCDGSSPACFRLTDRLFTGVRVQSLSHPEAHRFEGDTLFFLADENPTTPAGLDRFEGFVWAWRPGWARARPITTDRGMLCRGSQTGEYAFCVDNIADGTLTFDLRAGRIVDQDDSLLPLVERIAAIRGGGIAWSAQFSRADEQFLYSSWRDGEGAEALRVIAAAGLGTQPPRTVVADGWSWRLSPDGRAVFFMRGGSRNLLEGSLWAADVPSGAEPVEIAPEVFAFEPLADGGVGFLTELRGLEGMLHVQRDRRRPESRFRMAPGAHAWYPLAEGRFTYVLQVDGDGERGLIGDNQRGTTCLLASRPEVTAYSATLLPSLGAVHWSEPDPTDEETTISFFAGPEDCAGARPLGKGIQYLGAAGPRGLVFGSAPVRDAPKLNFFYVPSYDGRPLDVTGELILSGVERSNLAIVGAGSEAFVFGADESAPAGPGLYLFGPLPPTPH